MQSVRATGANNFDSLRLIFAILVIFSHAFPLLRGTNATEPLFVLTHGQITLGEISVWGFFVISGFLISKSWVRSPRPANFLKRRVARIYPGFIVASLLGAYAVVPLAVSAGTVPHVSIIDFVVSTLRLQVVETPPIFTANPAPNALNGSLWSVPFEFWCYIGVLLLGLGGLLRGSFLVAAAFAAAIASHLYLEIIGWHPGGMILGKIFGDPLIWVTVLPFFLAGMLFNQYGTAALYRRPGWALIAALLLVASLFVPHAVIVTMPICGAYLLMYAAYLPALNHLNLGRYGDFSYGVYLYAYPIEQMLVMYSGGRLSPPVLFAYAAVLSLAAGILSWFLVERRFLSQSTTLSHEGKLPSPT